jgi:hypothetical protein
MYLDDLEKEVKAAADILQKERYPEYIYCLYEIIHQAKHYQRLTESMLNGVTGARTFEDNEAENRRSLAEDDWYRFEGE